MATTLAAGPPAELPAESPVGPARRGLAFLAREVRHVLPPTIYFFVGFNLILLTKRLILAEYLIEFSGFMLATTAALVVGLPISRYWSADSASLSETVASAPKSARNCAAASSAANRSSF